MEFALARFRNISLEKFTVIDRSNIGSDHVTAPYKLSYYYYYYYIPSYSDEMFERISYLISTTITVTVVEIKEELHNILCERDFVVFLVLGEK